MSDISLVHCYNTGCGKKFDPSSNDNDSCEHHPGQPIFHDADKLWSCCKQRSKDFTVFLGMPGCTTGSHNPIKPAAAVADREVEVVQETPKTRQPVVQPKQRPAFDTKMVTLNPVVTPSLSQLLQKQSEADPEEDKGILDPDTGITIGEACKRNGCKASYSSAGSSLELCKYHPGGPVFHEGLKYWSCCQRKTTDFTEFLAQAGCSTDSHLWQDDTKSSHKTECRHDWHQTGSHVFVTVYAKATTPLHSSVSVSPVRLCASIRHANNLQYDLDIELAGLVDPSQCSTSFAATKVEIKLKKDESHKWARLQIQRRKEQGKTPETNGTDDANNQTIDDLTTDVDDVDLSDL